MTAVRVREAAGAIREDHPGDPFWSALADWLDACALVTEVAPRRSKVHAEHVARTYLASRLEEQPRDTCRVLEVDGEPVSVRGSGDWDQATSDAFADVVRAAKAKYLEEHAP